MRCSREDNKFLTESGAGTPMGELLRRFWMPVLLSRKLPEADGPPKKIVVMGEELAGVSRLTRRGRRHRSSIVRTARQSGSAATRNAASAASIALEIRHRRPLRRHALPYRSQRQGPDRIKSYPVREWGDMIWAYMGPAGENPELPDLEMALVPASHRYVSKKWQDCNWVQAMEGSIDTAHFTLRI